LVGPFDRNPAQQVRIDFVARRRTAQVRFGVEGLDAHNAHRPLDAFAIDVQHYSHPAAAEERVIQIQLVEPPEQTQVFRALRPWLVVVGRARQPEQFALLLDGQAPLL